MDRLLLASLANHTGGMLAVDSESLDPKEIGLYLAQAAQGTVLWPASVTWPKQFAQVYPEHMPPLRSDRDTIVIGEGNVSGEVKIELTAQVGGKSQPLSWTLAAGESNP